MLAMPSVVDTPKRGHIGALPDDLLEALVACGSVRKFPRNTIVVLEGEPAETLYIVMDGHLRVYVSDDEGREAELSRLGPSEYFGEMMLGSPVRTASVRTLTTARLCVVQRADFERLLQARPDLALHLIQTLIRRITALTGSVQSLALMDVYGRVARLFVELAREEDGRRFVPRMSQQKIAERIGASRSMVNRILKDLSEGGFISIGRDAIELHRELPRRW
jgi:CRP/FNR family cyclic AMP-dependent transcriptional regulator